MAGIPTWLPQTLKWGPAWVLVAFLIYNDRVVTNKRLDDMAGMLIKHEEISSYMKNDIKDIKGIISVHMSDTAVSRERLLMVLEDICLNTADDAVKIARCRRD